MRLIASSNVLNEWKVSKLILNLTEVRCHDNTKLSTYFDLILGVWGQTVIFHVHETYLEQSRDQQN